MLFSDVQLRNCSFAQTCKTIATVLYAIYRPILGLLFAHHVRNNEQYRNETKKKKKRKIAQI